MEKINNISQDKLDWKYSRRQLISKLLAMHKTGCIKIPFAMMWGNGVAVSIISLLVIVNSYFYKLFVDEVITEGKLERLPLVIGAIAGVFALTQICSFFSTWTTMKFKNRVNLKVKCNIFGKILGRNVNRHAWTDLGNNQKLIETESKSVAEFFCEQVVDRFFAFAFFAVYAILLFEINIWLSFMVLLFIPVTKLFGRYVGDKYNYYNNILRNVEASNNSFLADTLQKWREVKANRVEGLLTDKYEVRLEPEKQTNMKWMKYHALEKLYYSIKNDFVQKLLLFCVGGAFIVYGKITIGNLLMFISLTASLSAKLDCIISSSTQFASKQEVYKRVFAVLDEEDEDRENVKLASVNMTISNLSFSYSENQTKVLENASFEFMQGKRYLIEGKSGEGKSTLIKLMLGLYEPDEGEILLDGNNVKDLNSSQFYKSIGAVMQDNYFFNLSIKDNLKLLNEKATEEEINEVIRIVDLEETIAKLPKGYDTVIGEKGIRLSGGQKQRLAIARMLLRNPSIMIFDESTSALDGITEAKILDNLGKRMDKTVIFISHKPLVNISFDEKVIIKNGKLLKAV